MCIYNYIPANNTNVMSNSESTDSISSEIIITKSSFTETSWIESYAESSFTETSWIESYAVSSNLKSDKKS